MGRLKEATRKYYDEKLNWFSLDAYTSLKDLDLEGWYQQIEWRRDFYQLLSWWPEFYRGEEAPMDCLFSMCQTFLETIRKNPIAPFQCREEFNMRSDASTEPGRARRDFLYKALLVHPTTTEEFCLAEMNANRDRVVEVRRFFDRLDNYEYAIRIACGDTPTPELFQECINKTLGLEPWEQSDIQYKSWMRLPLHSFLNMKDSVIFTVSRHAPLRVAVAQFEQLLRNLQGETKERSASKLNYGEWADCGLLPFVDLEIWRLIDGLPKFGTDIEEIPNPVLTKRILSPALAMDHTVKHVTRLWFERLFVEKSDTFLLLQTRAAANRWLGSNKAPHRRQKQQTGVHVKHKS